MLANKYKSDFPDGERVSTSPFWSKVQRHYDGFSANNINYHDYDYLVTNTRLLALQYSQYIVSYVQELIDSEEINLDEPFHIVEFGAGIGCFSSFLIDELENIESRLSKPVKLVYVMTDVVKSYLDDWKIIPQFKEKLDSKRLVLGYFDVSYIESMQVQTLSEPLWLDELKNPAVFIANQLFSVLPVDVWYVQNYNLHPGLAPTQLDETQQNVWSVPPSLHVLEPRYDDKRFNQWIKRFASLQVERFSFAFPVSALEFLKKIMSRVKKHMFLITDFGKTGDDEAHIVKSFFSIRNQPYLLCPLNFDMLMNLYNSSGGDAKAMYQETVFNTLVLHSDKKEERWESIFNEFPDIYSSHAAILLMELIGEERKIKNIDDFIELINLSRFDAMYALLYEDKLQDLLKGVKKKKKKEFVNCLEKVEKHAHYFVKQDLKFLRLIGQMQISIKDYSKAFDVFEKVYQLEASEFEKHKALTMLIKLAEKNNNQQKVISYKKDEKVLSRRIKFLQLRLGLRWLGRGLRMTARYSVYIFIGILAIWWIFFIG